MMNGYGQYASLHTFLLMGNIINNHNCFQARVVRLRHEVGHERASGLLLLIRVAFSGISP
jgi:hypothetical protein